MKAKIILANATIVIIALIVLLNGYVMAFELPVYADSTTDGWTQVTTNEQLVEAFKYYCKSRDVTIDGSVAGGVTAFTTKAFQGACNTLGIDMTALQAQIKYQTDGNLGTKFLFTSLSIDAYNRIFAQFLQDNNLSVGDENVDKRVYSGKCFTDADGVSCLVYYVTRVDNNSSSTSVNVNQWGTPYKYTAYQCYNYFVANGSTSPQYLPTYHLNQNQSYNLSLKYISDSNNNQWYFTSSTPEETFRQIWKGTVLGQNANPCVFYDNTTGRLCFGIFSEAYTTKNVFWHYGATSLVRLDSTTTAPDATVNIVATVINNNVYEGDTIINNNGTPSDPSDTDPDEPDYNPYPDGGGTVTPPSNIGGNGSDGTINFPDLNLNLPEINWSLGDLSQKFPFSIPFDMIAFLTLLNGEPQAPHITGSIPLTSHYTWELDLDFSQFDTFAGIMRGLEFVGFMFFLISATINIVRG